MKPGPATSTRSHVPRRIGAELGDDPPRDLGAARADLLLQPERDARLEVAVLTIRRRRDLELLGLGQTRGNQRALQ